LPQARKWISTPRRSGRLPRDPVTGAAYDRTMNASSDLQLHLLRHAHAGDPTKWDGPDDIRPLSEKGRMQAMRMGLFLAEIAFNPDSIVSSPLARAIETARLVASALELPVMVSDVLAGPLDLASLDELLRHVGNPRSPMLVGHDPYFSMIAAELAGLDELPIRKGTLVRIDTTRPLRPGTGTLKWLVPPDLLLRQD